MIKYSAICSLLAIGLSGCVGEGYIPPTGPAGTYMTADGTEIECRRIKELGTRLGERVCMEPEEWAEVDRAEKETADDFASDVSRSGINRSTLSDIN